MAYITSNNLLLKPNCGALVHLSHNSLIVEFGSHGQVVRDWSAFCHLLFLQCEPKRPSIINDMSIT